MMKIFQKLVTSFFHVHLNIEPWKSYSESNWKKFKNIVLQSKLALSFEILLDSICMIVRKNRMTLHWHISNGLFIITEWLLIEDWNFEFIGFFTRSFISDEENSLPKFFCMPLFLDWVMVLSLKENERLILLNKIQYQTESDVVFLDPVRKVLLSSLHYREQ